MSNDAEAKLDELPIICKFCKFCNGEIEESDKPYCYNLFNFDFHNECARCTHCLKLFENGQQIHPDEDFDMFCSPCFSKLYSEFCFRCSEDLMTETRKVLDDRYVFHEKCFTCYRCNEDLTDIASRKIDEEYFKAKLILLQNENF